MDNIAAVGLLEVRYKFTEVPRQDDYAGFAARTLFRDRLRLPRASGALLEDGIGFAPEAMRVRGGLPEAQGTP